MNNSISRAGLDAAIAEVHRAGMPGLFAEVRDGNQVWSGACGLADTDTAQHVTTGMRHRVGSISKTFTAVAVLQQVENGEIGLDLPIGRYLPRLVPGPGGDAITVRMLLNHTSGLAEYLPVVYPSLKAFPRIADTTPQSLDDNRLTRFDPIELIEAGVAAPAAAKPGSTPGTYSNTNYLLLCRLLEHVTGTTAEKLITNGVIARAGLADTAFADSRRIDGPHSKMYESWFGMLEPPRDFSVFDMSWVGPAASVISTVSELNRFFGLLLAGAIVSPASLAQMQRTVPVISFEGKTLDYGLGLIRTDTPGHGTFWGHDGSVWGAGAISMTRADGVRQLSVAVNRQRWNRLGPTGKPLPHPIDDALAALYRCAMHGSEELGRVAPGGVACGSVDQRQRPVRDLLIQSNHR